MPPTNLHHAAGKVVQPDPVTGLQRVIQLQCHPAQDIAESILHREGEHGSDHRRGSQQTRRIQSDEVQACQDEGTVNDQQDDVLGNPGNDDAEPRQGDPEDDMAKQTKERKARADDENLVDHHRSTRVTQGLEQCPDELPRQAHHEQHYCVANPPTFVGQLMQRQQGEDKHGRNDVLGLGQPEIGDRPAHQFVHGISLADADGAQSVRNSLRNSLRPTRRTTVPRPGRRRRRCRDHARGR